ncbi:hypothetical protein SK128_017050, partial [Halocaridina rubra]
RWFGADDGRKAVCLDPVLGITPGNCSVLSFGINNEWSFDDAFDRFGCKVYAFDPTMGAEDHQRSTNIRFLNLGIGNIQGKRKVGMDKHFDYFQIARSRLCTNTYLYHIFIRSRGLVCAQIPIFIFDSIHVESILKLTGRPLREYIGAATLD